MGRTTARSRGKEQPPEQIPLYLVLPLLSVGCVSGASFERHEAAILDGDLDRGDPAIVYLSMGGGACTGSIIDPRLVLTAKHCVVDEYGGGTLSPGSFEVYTGLNPAGGDGETVASSGDIVAVHLFDDGWSIEGVDIALLEAGSDLGVAPVPFSTDENNPSPGANVEAAGYGQYDDWNYPDGNKRRGSGVVQDNMGNEIQTTPITCYGDSGGPLFDAQGTVIGITSRGTQDACSAGDDIYTNVGHFAQWISQFLTAPAVDPEPEPEPDPGDDPGEDPGEDPGGDPGEDPGDDPGDDPGPGTDPGDDPGGGPGDDRDEPGAVDDGPLADFGDECSEGGACDSRACVAVPDGAGYCTESCSGDSCPYGFSCTDTAQGAFCLLEDEGPPAAGPGDAGYRGLQGACAAAPGSAAGGMGWLLVLGALAFLARRR